MGKIIDINGPNTIQKSIFVKVMSEILKLLENMDLNSFTSFDFKFLKSIL
jgi:hypothetical protein